MNPAAGNPVDGRRAAPTAGFMDLPLERTLAILAGIVAILMTTHSLHLLFAERVAEGIAESETSRGNPVYLALFVFQGGLFATLMILRILAGRVTPTMMLAALTCVFFLASTLWSVGPSTTLFNAVVLSNQIVAAYVLAVHLPVRQFLRLFFFVGAGIVVASFVLLAVEPDLAGTVRYGGGWLTDLEFSGVMASKNHAGAVFAAIAILALHGRLIGIAASLRLVVLTLAVAGVILSNSATALLILLIIGAATVFFRLIGPVRNAAAFTFQLFLVAAMLLAPFIDPGTIAWILERDATFTGRTDLWAVAFDAFAQRPLLGHGYYGFFDTGVYSPVWGLWDNFLYFFTSSFHNSAVDTAVSLGFAGIVILIVLCVSAGLVAFRSSIDPASRLLAMALLAVYTIASTMELAILHHNHVATIIVFYLAFAAAGENRLESTRPANVA